MSDNSSFIKKVLVDKGELDRLHQRQLKEYSPELHSMAQLQTNMAETLARNDLSNEQKLDLLNTYSGRFDTLRRETGIFSNTTAPPVNGAAAAAEAAQVDKKDAKVVVVKDQDKDKQEEEEEKQQEEDQQDDYDEALTSVRKLKLEPLYEKKAAKLMRKILDNPDVIERKANGKVSINGKVEPDTNFNSIFKSLFGHSEDLDQPGSEEFLAALKQLGVKKDELSGKRVHSKYIKVEPLARQIKDDPFKLELAPKRTKGPMKSSVVAPRGAASTSASSASSSGTHQTGHGIKRKAMTTHPPGLKPKILYVY